MAKNIKLIIYVMFITLLLMSASMHVSKAGCLSNGSEQNKLAESFMELVKTLQGQNFKLQASNSVCIALMPPIENTAEKAKAWYFEKGSCGREFTPDLNAFNTAASFGARQISISNKKELKHIKIILDKLKKGVADQTQSLSPLLKLEIQQLLWEFYTGIYLFRSEEIEELDIILTSTKSILEQVLLDKQDIELLKNSVTFFNIMSDIKDNELIQIIAEKKDEALEIVDFPQMHVALTHARLTPRVFLVPTDISGYTKLKKLINTANNVNVAGFSWAKIKYKEIMKQNKPLINLLYEVPNLKAVLILYFNVLDKNLKITPTPVVASWREYKVEGVLSDKMDFSEMEKKYKFKEIEYRRDFNPDCKIKPIYKWINPHDSKVFGIFNVTPYASNEPPLLTSHRGTCLRCHGHSIGALTTMQNKEYRTFTPPFYYASDSQHILGDVSYFEKQLRLWMK